MTWHRVTPSRLCSQCSKSDWCTYDDTGAACCMRVPSDKPMRNGGYLHGATAPAAATVPRRPVEVYEDPTFDAWMWWAAARHVCSLDKLASWAERLGLSCEAIDWMGGCHLGEMLCFPMYDGLGNICGIRTRNPDGSKRAVTGSRAGVFLPNLHMDGDPLVCEGPTDAAAAVDLGFEPIGRPSCAGCERHVIDTCRRWGYDRVTVCADADGLGIAGATRLADLLRAARIGVRLVTPGGHKDLRDWWRAGVRREQVDSAWSQSEWR